MLTYNEIVRQLEIAGDLFPRRVDLGPSVIDPIIDSLVGIAWRYKKEVFPTARGALDSGGERLEEISDVIDGKLAGLGLKTLEELTGCTPDVILGIENCGLLVLEDGGESRLISVGLAQMEQQDGEDFYANVALVANITPGQMDIRATEPPPGMRKISFPRESRSFFPIGILGIS